MRDHSFRVLLIDTKYRNPNHYICLALYSALQRHPHVAFVAKSDPLDAVAVAAKNECNLLIAFDGEELDEVLCQRLATVCGRSILWVTEDPYELDVNLRHAKLFDLVFTNDSSSVAAYGAKGRHLPLAGAVEFHSFELQPADRPLRYDLFFAGTAWPNRSAFVRSILSEMPGGWKFKLALPTNPLLPPHGVDLPESTLSWRTPPTEFARFVNRSAVTLLLPRVFSASGGRSYAETPPPRLFEAALAGGVQMVHESLQEVSRSFEPDKEIVLFSSTADFITKAERLIGDRAYRDSIAGAARARALAEHTYDKRVETILSEAGRIVRSASSVDMRRPRTLMFVVHNVVNRGNFGGIEVYLERIRTKLGPDWKILFYLAGEGTKAREARVLSGDYDELARYRVNEAYGADMLSSQAQEQAFRRALLEQSVDLVHFHHFIGHVPSMVYVAAELGVPTAFTAHDFFPVCHEFNLLSFKHEFCGAPDVSISQCDVCLWQKHRIAPGSQTRRRAFWNDVMRRCDLIIFNTESTRDIYARMLPAVRQHERAIVLPVPVLDGPVQRRQRTTSAKLKIAILGNVTRQKGGELIGRVIPMLADAPVEFHVFGRIDFSYGRLGGAQQTSNLIVHGPYSADALPAALKDCEVSLHLSIWPETYCLTLSEAWQQGLVPIVSDIGALGERVRHGVNGLKIAPESEGQLIDIVRRLIDEPELIDTLRAGISEQLYSSLSPHVDALRDSYEAILRAPQPTVDAAAKIEHRTLADMGIVLPSTKWHVGANEGSGVQESRSARLRFVARRLAGLYRSRGLKETLRLVANRVRSRI
ncbi:glycosyltransferase family protein [Caballeronia sp. HLA56]